MHTIRENLGFSIKLFYFDVSQKGLSDDSKTLENEGFLDHLIINES